jgi:predicted kinase
MNKEKNFIILMNGLQACGKTTTARKIANGTNAILIANHSIRQEICGDKPSYTKEETEFVRMEVLNKAEKHIIAGKSVVADAMHITRSSRIPFYLLARKYSILVLVVECICLDEFLLQERVNIRKVQIGPEFEGNDVEYYQKTKNIAESVHDDEAVGFFPKIISLNTVDNTTFTKFSGNNLVDEIIRIINT